MTFRLASYLYVVDQALAVSKLYKTIACCKTLENSGNMFYAREVHLEGGKSLKLLPLTNMT